MTDLNNKSSMVLTLPLTSVGRQSGRDTLRLCRILTNAHHLSLQAATGWTFTFPVP